MDEQVTKETGMPDSGIRVRTVNATMRRAQPQKTSAIHLIVWNRHRLRTWISNICTHGMTASHKPSSLYDAFPRSAAVKTCVQECNSGTG